MSRRDLAGPALGDGRPSGLSTGSIDPLLGTLSVDTVTAFAVTVRGLNGPLRVSRATDGDTMRLRDLGVTLASAVLAVLLSLIGQPALAATPSTASAGLADHVSAAQAYRPLTEANFRYNLGVRTGKNPSNCQAHHTLPRKYSAVWQRAGINHNDPAYGLWWISTAGVPNNHGSQASNYNNAWQTFFDVNPNPSRAQILTQRSQMVRAYSPFYRC